MTSDHRAGRAPPMRTPTDADTDANSTRARAGGDLSAGASIETSKAPEEGVQRLRLVIHVHVQNRTYVYLTTR